MSSKKSIFEWEQCHRDIYPGTFFTKPTTQLILAVATPIPSPARPTPARKFADKVERSKLSTVKLDFCLPNCQVSPRPFFPTPFLSLPLLFCGDFPNAQPQLLENQLGGRSTATVLVELYTFHDNLFFDGPDSVRCERSHDSLEMLV